ncbi:MAG: hypothetical protein QNJ74_29505 [Trichodesmium sp. MO_231.B1]|nr:hypothetical protein [Trichodesmium sp. MO_231.B1]
MIVGYRLPEKQLINYIIFVVLEAKILRILGSKEKAKEINLGKRNNQNFVQIPHHKFIEKLKYKADISRNKSNYQRRKLHLKSQLS